MEKNARKREQGMGVGKNSALSGYFFAWKICRETVEVHKLFITVEIVLSPLSSLDTSRLYRLQHTFFDLPGRARDSQ